MKNLILFSLFVFSSCYASAQFEIRPYIGANFSDVTKVPSGTKTQAKLGGQFGANVVIGNKLHLMPGIAYFTRSTEYSTADNTKFDQSISGVIIPILVGYRFVDASTEPLLNVRVFAGPSLMFLTQTEFSNNEVNEVVDWKESQWGAQLGLGLDISVFFVDFGYEFGLSNTAEGNLDDGFTDVKNNTFYVNAGVRLSLSK
jgi:hypothetical protein